MCASCAAFISVKIESASLYEEDLAFLQEGGLGPFDHTDDTAKLLGQTGKTVAAAVKRIEGCKGRVAARHCVYHTGNRDGIADTVASRG